MSTLKWRHYDCHSVVQTFHPDPYPKEDNTFFIQLGMLSLLKIENKNNIPEKANFCPTLCEITFKIVDYNLAK